MIVLLIVTFSNFWLWKILQQNVLLTCLLLLLTLLLFASTQNSYTKFTRSIAPILLIIFSFTSFILISKNFDPALKTQNPTEVKLYNKRHEYFAAGFGPFFANKLSLRFYKNIYPATSTYLKSLSYSIDPNLYFFISHPREKPGIDEFEKYSPLLLPFFVIGFFIHFLNFFRYKVISTYLISSIAITGFIDPHFILGPVLLFPYLNILIFFGLSKTFVFFSEKYAKN